MCRSCRAQGRGQTAASCPPAGVLGPAVQREGPSVVGGGDGTGCLTGGVTPNLGSAASMSGLWLGEIQSQGPNGKRTFIGKSEVGKATPKRNGLGNKS